MIDKKIISRKEAIQKLGKYGKFTALTALGTFAILNPQMAQAFSDPGPIPNGIFNPNDNNGIGIWGADNRYNRFKNEGFKVPFSNDLQYGPFQSFFPFGFSKMLFKGAQRNKLFNTALYYMRLLTFQTVPFLVHRSFLFVTHKGYRKAAWKDRHRIADQYTKIISK